QLLVDWNNTARAYPRTQSLHQLFEAHAASKPEAIALTFRDHRMTYAELNSRANQLAHYLLKQGIGRGQRVGIYMERSPEMMVALLGVQKSGAAYVPLDPEYPADRIGLILQDAEVSITISQ